jgi:hypothetical protein
MNDLQNPKICDFSKLKRFEKQNLGMKAKLIFDISRVKKMRKNNHNVRIVRYTDESVERNLIISNEK